MPVSAAQRGFVLDDTHRVVVALGGRGSGKTHCGVVKCLRHVLDYPGARVWFVAPDEKRLRDGLLDKFHELCPPDLIREQRLIDKEIRLANESRIGWRSTDVLAGLRAGEQSFAVFDEAAWSPYAQAKRAYRDLRAGLRLRKRQFWCDNEWFDPEHPWIEILEQGSQQSFISVTYKSQLAITTTPATTSYINELLEVPPESCRVYNLHTEDNIANLPEDYLEELREVYAGEGQYRQEALGELVGVDSADYPTFDPRKHVMAGPAEYSLSVGGIDWGYRNALAITIVGFTSNGVAFGREEWGGSHIELDQALLKANELMVKHNVHVFFCDQASPANIAYFNRNGVPAVKQAVIQKAYRTAAVASRFQRTEVGTYRLYIDPAMRNTIKQLRFAGDSTQDPAKLKEVKSGRPGNDYLDSLEYAITGGERMLGSFFIPTMARAQKRDEGNRPSFGVPFRFIG